MKSLKTLWFQSCSITDAGLEQLVGLDSLEGLLLHRTKVTDQGLRHITKFPSLKTLSIVFGANVLSEERPAFEHLEFFRGLKSLTIGGKGLRIDDLIEIAEISGLERLQIRNLVLDDVGIGYLSKLTSLKRLSLDETTTMTDEGIKELSKLRKLESLTISGPMTDESLAHLKNLKFLNSLKIGSPYITEKGIANLEKAVPALQMVYRLKWRPVK
ncbi:MAG: hypothetical protein IH899_05255, partial [Planctomycetes bacterium]|nr:hypothetical protein [Planctomycetota bacterium]